ncbi:DUF1016 N-terminal domain-containing protein [Pseudoalteromonas sp. APC 3224]|uniref:DUF1016 N-terminal domain-containing protein n=1 Tax=Pseudoalteromonas sp. APC 3224 TaxID=3035203 RepID=UPI0025B4EBE5|nr:DUF1016 N-terminal domain-containing protein [Pseudoalteromonas sp. APC 3224]MDN3487171.1 DUF1016 N-terminal domain-containing protein [Pseudoalteromonas sp. APC 3224]
MHKNKHLKSPQRTEYKQWLTELKQRVASSQQKAAWGDKLLAQLSQDLMAEFLQMKDFLKRNLEHIRRWYLFWCGDDAIAKQAVSQLLQIPWGHNIQITQCRSISAARGRA